MSEDTLYKLTVTLPADLEELQVGSLSLCLEDHALATSILPPKDGAGWRIEWLMTIVPDEADRTARLAVMTNLVGLQNLADRDVIWTTETMPALDWVAASYRPVPAFTIGPFFICAPEDKTPPPAGSILLKIEAATAFGSGEHGTTAGCLKALADLKAQAFTPRNILDLGTGSGILALAARKLWPEAAILATDIEDEAVRVTQHHCVINGAPEISCLQSDGFAASAIAARAPFDLIIANILAAPLKEMAGDLAAALAPQGKAILSGMLREQTEKLLSVYSKESMAIENRYDEDEWTSLILHGLIPP
ncbi:MAG: 50S ribosomal protein L11 methyltransferase [Rhodospirillales bacterium]|nr:50S ribosomal protein L11 methyltransferase [Rhodospirillales bacterium]